MILFNMKKKLKREELLNSIDAKKFWNKSASTTEIKEMLNTLKDTINKHKYKTDKCFFKDSRREVLKDMILKRETNEESIKESLFNFMEYINCEYCGNSPRLAQELKIHQSKLMDIWDKYKEKGIICLEEKEDILEMINHIKNEISKLN